MLVCTCNFWYPRSRDHKRNNGQIINNRINQQCPLRSFKSGNISRRSTSYFPVIIQRSKNRHRDNFRKGNNLYTITWIILEYWQDNSARKGPEDNFIRHGTFYLEYSNIYQLNHEMKKKHRWRHSKASSFPHIPIIERIGQVSSLSRLILLRWRRQDWRFVGAKSAGSSYELSRIGPIGSSSRPRRCTTGSSSELSGWRQHDHCLQDEYSRTIVEADKENRIGEALPSIRTAELSGFCSDENGATRSPVKFYLDHHLRQRNDRGSIETRTARPLLRIYQDENQTPRLVGIETGTSRTKTTAPWSFYQDQDTNTASDGQMIISFQNN